MIYPAHNRCSKHGAVIIRLSSSRGSHTRDGKARTLCRSIVAQQEGRHSLCARQAGSVGCQEGTGIFNTLPASMGRRARARALSCSPQETLRHIGYSRRLLRADLESLHALASPCKSDDCLLSTLHLHGRGKHPCPINLALAHVTCFGLLLVGQ